MKPLPMPVRIAAGLVATAVEQARDLPRLVTELPVTAVSQALQASMRVQQRVTELAIKGDRALGALRPVPETPSWATFDDDEPPTTNGASVTAMRARATFDDEPAPASTEGLPADPEDPIVAADPAAEVAAETIRDEAAAETIRGESTRGEAAEAIRGEPTRGEAAGDDGPTVLPGYAGMTIPQLRGRLRALGVDDLRSLLQWEISHGNRPPYVTMLGNRIVTVTEE